MSDWSWKTAIGNLAGYAVGGYLIYIVIGIIGIVAVTIAPVVISIAIGVGVVYGLNWILKKLLGL